MNPFIQQHANKMLLINVHNLSETAKRNMMREIRRSSDPAIYSSCIHQFLPHIGMTLGQFAAFMLLKDLRVCKEYAS